MVTSVYFTTTALLWWTLDRKISVHFRRISYGSCTVLCDTMSVLDDGAKRSIGRRTQFLTQSHHSWSKHYKVPLPAASSYKLQQIWPASQKWIVRARLKSPAKCAINSTSPYPWSVIINPLAGNLVWRPRSQFGCLGHNDLIPMFPCCIIATRESLWPKQPFSHNFSVWLWVITGSGRFKLSTC